MGNKDILKGIIEDLELMTEDDLPFSKCDEDCEECESVCEEYFQEDTMTQIAILHRITKRIYTNLAPEYKKSLADVPIQTLCDIFGWDDIFEEVKA